MRSPLLTGLIIAAPLCASVSALAQSTALPGKATIGAASRDIVVRFSCAMDRGRINNLAIELDLPAATDLSLFDVNRFEGPDGARGTHRLVVSGPRKAEMTFGATGSYGNDGAPDTTFTFSAGMVSGAGLRDLRAIVATLGAGPSHLTYTITNPVRGGLALQAAIDLSAADAARLHQAIRPCL